MESPLTWAALGAGILFFITVGGFANTLVQQGKREKESIFNAISRVDNKHSQNVKDIYAKLDRLDRENLEIVRDHKNDIINVYRDILTSESKVTK